MKLWPDFYDQYLGDVPGCTYFMAENELRQAAREFCERSQAWRARMEPITTVAGRRLYSFDYNSRYDVCKVIGASLDGQYIHIMLPGDEIQAGASGLLALNQRDFELYPTPAGGLTLQISAILKPSMTAQGLDDALYAEYAPAIAQGAKARLFIQANQQYTNPGAAAACRETFDQQVGRATIRAAKAYSRAPLRTRASFF
jgi:hypothetical protein